MTESFTREPKKPKEGEEPTSKSVFTEIYPGLSEGQAKFFDKFLKTYGYNYTFGLEDFRPPRLLRVNGSAQSFLNKLVKYEYVKRHSLSNLNRESNVYYEIIKNPRIKK